MTAAGHDFIDHKPATEFGLTAHKYEPWDETEDEKRGWIVELPHQCDAWTIAGSEYDPVPYEEAIARLERFVAEAQSVLDELRKAGTA